MGRIRTIKPEFWTNEKLCSLPEGTHLFAAALLNYADDEGYFNANHKLIIGALYALRDPSIPIPDMLKKLVWIGYLRLGTGDDGRHYGHIVNFREHQKVDRPTKSKIKDLAVFDESSTSPRRILDEPSSTDQGSGIRDQGREGSAEGDAAAPLAADAAPLVAVPEVRAERLTLDAPEPKHATLPPDVELVRQAIAAKTGAAPHMPSAFKGLRSQLKGRGLTVDDALLMVDYLAGPAADGYWLKRGIPPPYVFSPRNTAEILPLARGWRAGTLRTSSKPTAPNPYRLVTD